MSATTRLHVARVRRVLSLHRRPMSRGEVYERANLDHIDHVDAALAQMVDMGEAVQLDTGDGRRWIRAESHRTFKWEETA